MSDLENTNYETCLTWSNLTVTSNIKKISKCILNDSFGMVRSGEMLAIMGPFEAGKSTLLKYLINQPDSTSKKLSGEILLNNLPINSVPYSSLVGFVPQGNILFMTMTVREILSFTAALTHDVSSDDRKLMVDKTIEDLDLTSVADEKVFKFFHETGSEIINKKVSIGMEVIARPCILALENPISGLDNLDSTCIINFIKDIQKKYNMAIIMTIISPNSQVFNSFDKLILLSEGVTVYFGNAESASSYFDSLGFKAPENYNLADHFLKVIADENLKKKAFPKDSLEFTNSKTPLPMCYKASVFSQFWYLTRRAFTDMTRNSLNLWLKLFKFIFNSLLILLVFWDLNRDYEGIQDRASAIFLILFVIFFESNLTILFMFQTQKPIVMREIYQKRYNLFIYFFTYNLVLIFFELIFDIKILSIVYKAIDLDTDSDAVVKFGLVCAISGMIGTGTGLAFAILSESEENIVSMISLFVFPAWLWTGYLVNYDSLPDWVVLKYASPFYFLFQAGILSQVQHLKGAANSNEQYIDDLNLAFTFKEALFLSAAVALSYRVLDFLLIWYKFRVNSS